MQIIKLLPENLANQIAAGEVIQRPASVVKELLENAIDAKASEITLSIKDGGRTLIAVKDNGAGMSPVDAEMSFQRHATSKLRQFDDLYNLNTMGFRGEALASIAAVSHVTLATKRRRRKLDLASVWKEVKKNPPLKRFVQQEPILRLRIYSITYRQDEIF